MVDVKKIDFADYFRGVFKAQHLDFMDEWRKANWYDLRGKSETGRYNEKNGEWIWLEDKRSGGQQKWENKTTGKLATDWPEDKVETAYVEKNGERVLENIPVPETMSDADWEKFYRICRKTFRAIAANKTELARKLPPGEPMVADQFIGKEPFKAFSLKTLSSNTKDKISKLANLLEKNSRLRLYVAKDVGFDEESYSIGTFIGDLKNGDAESKLKVKDRLARVLTSVSNIVDTNAFSRTATTDALKSELLAHVFVNGNNDIETMLSDVNDDNDEQPTTIQMAQFKNPAIYREIIKKLYDPSKDSRESAFLGQFREYGGREIAEIFSEQVKEVNYLTGGDAVQPKFEEQFNTIEKIKDKWGGWRDEHLKRFYSRAHRHIYAQPEAPGIVAAMAKENISPTDGVLKWLEKKDALRKRIQATDPAGLKGFDLLMRALDAIKNGAKSDNMLQGALRNGKKARKLAIEIIKFGMSETTDRAKEADIKVALEVLAVMRYDTFSSAHGKELWKNKLDLFKGASFMKNDAVEFIMNAASGAINLSVNGLYWAGVMGRNLIQHARGRIDIPLSDSDKKTFQTALEQIQKQSEGFRNPEQAQQEFGEKKAAFKKSSKDNLDLLIQRNAYDKLKIEIDEMENAIDETGELAKGIVRLNEIDSLMAALPDKKEIDRINKEIRAQQEFVKKSQKILQDTRAELKRFSSKNADDISESDKQKKLVLEARISQVSADIKTANSNLKTLNAQLFEKFQNITVAGDATDIPNTEKKPDQLSEQEQLMRLLSGNTDEYNGEYGSDDDSEIDPDSLKRMRPQHILSNYGYDALNAEAERLRGVINSSNLRDLKIGALGLKSKELELKKRQLTDANRSFGYGLDDEKVTAEQKKNQERIAEHNQLHAEMHVAEEFAVRLQGIKSRGEKKAVDDKPANPGLSKNGQQEMLMEFWNMVNGYNDDIQVESFWSLRNIKKVRADANINKQFVTKKQWEND